MRVPLRNMAGQTVGEVELRDDVFAVPVNDAVMHQALVRQRANARLGTVNTKTRSEVSGGGRKPWRQKGTGRARQGSIRAPHWKGGGVVFGPHPRSYEQKMPRKMRRLALRSALSVKAAEAHVVVLDQLSMEAPKTKEMVALLGRLAVDGTALILLHEPAFAVEQAASNLPQVKTLRTCSLNVADLLGYDYLIMPQAAVDAVHQHLGQAVEAAAGVAAGQ
ncbi:MAG TPA: 50S ribosomal protein L4 [Anaerolineae bacterium]|nr:50S ribosomal protein L4 [Anaerolineae bacterium]